jgi:predicted NAD-dependent protein-ADP-ribosyltransferase YbiA (DUF1768 family)
LWGRISINPEQRGGADMDIGSGSGWPSSALSNFSPHGFWFRGIWVESMEGLLQALKFENPEMQKFVCTLVGRKAKFKGKKKKWFRTQTLFWQEQPIDRHGPEYQALLDEAFEAMFTQNLSARRALLATANAVLTHSMGKIKPSETVLTRSEFCSRLMRIRAKFQEQVAGKK